MPLIMQQNTTSEARADSCSAIDENSLLKVAHSGSVSVLVDTSTKAFSDSQQSEWL